METTNASTASSDSKRSTESLLASALLASESAVFPTSVAPLEGLDEYNDIGIPVVFLWLPYTVLSCVLVGLMVVSFMRFHFKHGHKYRRRREQFWRELNVQEILRGTQTERSRLLRPTDRIDGLLPGSEAPPQVAWSDAVHSDDIYRALEHSPGGATDSQRSTAKMATLNERRRHKMSLAVADSSFRRRRSLIEHFRSSVCSRKRKRNRHPVAFSSNLNGSMVNIRCGEKESLSTFQSCCGLDAGSNPGLRLPNRDGIVFTGNAQRKPDIWTVQTGYRPRLLSAVSGTFGSNNSALAKNEA